MINILQTTYLNPGIVSVESSLCATIHWGSSCVLPICLSHKVEHIKFIILLLVWHCQLEWLYRWISLWHLILCFTEHPTCANPAYRFALPTKTLVASAVPCLLQQPLRFADLSALPTSLQLSLRACACRTVFDSVSLTFWAARSGTWMLDFWQRQMDKISMALLKNVTLKTKQRLLSRVD